MTVVLAPLWDWGYTWEILPILGDGLIVTLRATAVGTVIALTLGLLVAVARRSASPLLSYPALAFTEFVRSTPLMVQIFFLYFGIPDLEIFPQFHVDLDLTLFGTTIPLIGVIETNSDGGLLVNGFLTGSIALGLHYAAYTSEVYRAGIDGIERGQWEASTALNLRIFQTWTRVILPQAVPTVVPALGNYVIAMFKEAPLLTLIAVVELLGEARGECSRTFRCLEPYTMVGVIFLSISIPASLIVRYVERRIGFQRA